MNTASEIRYANIDLPAPGAAAAVAPGVHWVRMPLPFALDHINLWLLDDGEGVTIVDAGIALDAVRAHWETVLAQVLRGRPLRRLIVTHFHPDHFGLAAWLAGKHHRAPVFMTQGEYLTGAAIHAQLPGVSVESMLAQFRRNGLDAQRMDALARRGNAYRRGVPELPASFVRIMDGDELDIGGKAWQVRVGYGHSPEHAALYCPALGVLISGDMVLPRISTNISVFAVNPDGDPLRLYLDSLARYAQLPADTLVLPSHGRPFRGLQARCAQLAQHHDARCAELLAACTAPRTAAEVLNTLFPRELDTHQVMFAMGEAIAHLNHLHHGGKLGAREDDDGCVRFVNLH